MTGNVVWRSRKENRRILNKILEKKTLGPQVKEFVFEAPVIARKAKPGQFLILRVTETGERIPLTIADANPERGTLTIVVQEVGKTTMLLGALEVGDAILDIIGPLGIESEIEPFGTVVCVGGGVGIACVYPIAKALKAAGNKLLSIIGARSRDLLIWEDRMRQVSDETFVTTDDGSYGQKGFVTDVLKRLVDEGRTLNLVYAVGPAVMMRAVANVTRQPGIRTIASLNSIMVDGTGMCGGCRVQVGEETKFVCVDGPEFDAHQVDFDELMKRQRSYTEQEQCSVHSLRK